MTTTKDSPVAEQLEGTIKVLEEQGWCQQAMVDGRTGKVCLIGALLMANGAKVINTSKPDYPWFRIDSYPADWPWFRIDSYPADWPTEALKFLSDRLGYDVHAWNDHFAQSVEDVIIMLKNAAEEARESDHAA